MVRMKKSDEFIARERKIQNQEMELIGRPSGFIAEIRTAFSEIYQQRNLLFLLVKRDIKIRYKDSTLGLFWSFGKPLVQLAIYFFAVGQVLGAARSIPDFAIFIFIGITSWTLFSEVIINSTHSIFTNAGLVKKIYVPREIFPIAGSGMALFNFFMQSIILVLAILLFARPPLTLDLLMVPLAILTIFVFASAIGLVLSALNVFLRDTEHLVEVVLALLFWFSPIVYSYTFVANSISPKWLLEIYLANPVTISIISLQKGLWIGGFDSGYSAQQVWPENLVLRLVATLIVSCVLYIFSMRIFARFQGNFAQQL